MMNIEEHEWFMKLALEQAEKAAIMDEVPVGAVLVDPAGKVFCESHNLKEAKNNPCSHAEVEVIVAACEKLGDWRLDGYSLFVTLEPCAMCAGAILHSRIKNIVFGAYDPKGGVLSSSMNIWGNPNVNHKVKIVGGIMHFECSKILSNFFKQRRHGYV